MKSPKLTARQIETLRHIHDFISKHGMAPTILELRNAMGVASDQGVIEILQRLEDRKANAGASKGLEIDLCRTPSYWGGNCSNGRATGTRCAWRAVPARSAA